MPFSNILLRFKVFEASQKDIAGILEYWDRTILAVNRPSTPEGTAIAFNLMNVFGNN